MRVQKKNKSAIQRGLFLTVLAKNRHYSTTHALPEAPAKAVANEIVEMLLEEVYQAQRNNEFYYNNLKTFWKELQLISTGCCQLMKTQAKQVLCVLEQQPQPEQKKSKGVVGPQVLKKSLLKTVKSRGQFSIAEESIRHSIYEGDKRDRDLLIQKLKKEYTSVLHTKYSSESMPIEQSRSFFKEKDAPVVETYRNSLNSSNINKQLKKAKAKKYQNHESSKQKQLTTFQKKSKAYIDKIDPTNSVFQRISQAQSLVSPKRGSIYRFDSSFLMGVQESVMVRESNFKQISNSVMPKREILNKLGLSFDKQTARLPTIQSGERQQFSQRIECSVHVASKTKKLTTQSGKKEIRQKNSMSICVLPKIHKH